MLLGASDPLPGVHQSIKKPRLGLGSLDGAKRIRTADPLHAMQVLYQVKSIQVTSVCGFLRVVMRQTVRQVAGALETDWSIPLGRIPSSIQ